MMQEKITAPGKNDKKRIILDRTVGIKPEIISPKPLLVFIKDFVVVSFISLKIPVSKKSSKNRDTFWENMLVKLVILFLLNAKESFASSEKMPYSRIYIIKEIAITSNKV